MADLRLRDATDADQSGICELTLAAYQEYATGMGERGWGEYQRNIRDTLSKPAPAEQIVAEHDGKLLGTVLLYPGGTSFDGPGGIRVTFEFPEVRLLAVDPAGRGQGVGVALMRECMDRAQKAGAEAIALHTTDWMQVAMQMYERMGYVRVPELDFSPAPNFVIKAYRYTFPRT